MKFWIFGLVALSCIALAAQAAAFEITNITPATYQIVELDAVLSDGDTYYMDRAYVISLVPDEVLEEVADKIAEIFLDQ